MNSAALAAGLWLGVFAHVWFAGHVELWDDAVGLPASTISLDISRFMQGLDRVCYGAVWFVYGSIQCHMMLRA